MDPQMPQQTPPQNEPAPARTDTTLIVLLSFLSLILLASTGFLYYKNLQLQKQVASIARPVPQIPTPTPSPTPNPTMGWTTYTNIAGYSFQYPATWVTRNAAAGAGQEAQSTTKLFQLFDPSVNQQVSAGVITVQTLDSAPQLPSSEITTSVLVNGFPATKIDKPVEGGFSYLSYYIKLPTATYINFQFTYATADQLQVFNTILSTFRFTEQPSPPQTNVSCSTNADCPTGTTCMVYGPPIAANGPQQKECVAPGQAVPL